MKNQPYKMQIRAPGGHELIDVWLQRLRSGDLSEEEAREEALQIGQIEGTFALGDALDSLPSDEEHSAARLALALAIVARIGTDQLLERGASAL